MHQDGAGNRPLLCEHNVLARVCLVYAFGPRGRRPRESIELGAGPFLLGASYGYREALAESEYHD